MRVGRSRGGYDTWARCRTSPRYESSGELCVSSSFCGPAWPDAGEAPLNDRTDGKRPGDVEDVLEHVRRVLPTPALPVESISVGPLGPSGAGGDYLRRRRVERDRIDDAYRRAAAVADRVEAGLALLAVDHRHRPQPAQPSGEAGDNVLNASYLVERERVGEFALLISQLGAHETGVRVEVTGTWAPYSFVDATQGGGP